MISFDFVDGLKRETQMARLNDVFSIGFTMLKLVPDFFAPTFGFGASNFFITTVSPSTFERVRFALKTEDELRRQMI